MSNKRVKSIFVRQRAFSEGETKEQRFVFHYSFHVLTKKFIDGKPGFEKLAGKV